MSAHLLTKNLNYELKLIIILKYDFNKQLIKNENRISQYHFQNGVSLPFVQLNKKR